MPVHSTSVAHVAAYVEVRGLTMPPSLAKLFDSDLPGRLDGIMYRPGRASEDELSWAHVEGFADSSDWPLLGNLVPLLPVDERSIACVVLSYADDEPWPGEGAVVRWHFTAPSTNEQGALLDTDCYAYVESVAKELDARDEGLERMLKVIGPAYQETYIDHEKRPRDFIVRPVRIACQNVIVGLAAIAHDASFDGLSVISWQTCEVPHVAANEANRALTALMLCDAFQNGGTMEIRFDRRTRVKYAGDEHWYEGHPEHGVPASLRRYGRTVGVQLGVDNPRGISPREARDLFQAITPMPDRLRERVDHAINAYGISPERMCFTLLNPVWRDIELDYLLATTPRAGSILGGGCSWKDRSSRQAEAEVCRAAVMAGMLYRRLNATDAAGADGVARVVEDRRAGVDWQVLDEQGAVRFRGLTASSLIPWSVGLQLEGAELTVFPRSLVTAAVLEEIMRSPLPGQRALVVPRDTDLPKLPGGLFVLTCPDRQPDIDKAIEAKLLTARISRG